MVKLAVIRSNLVVVFLAVTSSRNMSQWIFCPIYLKCIARSAHSTCPDDEPHWLVRNASTKISPCDFRRRILQKFDMDHRSLNSIKEID